MIVQESKLNLKFRTIVSQVYDFTKLILYKLYKCV